MIASERERWKAAHAWLARLLALPADARQAALAQATLEPMLHQRVARLLAAAQAPDPRLEPGSDGLLVDPEPPNCLAGRHVGDWELLEEIGRGGMSVVYRARRAGAGYEQLAAVKLLGLASLGRGGAARFDQERRVLASMRHPHIAALMDGGVAEDGTPWLAMQLVAGEHIDSYCSRHGLDLATRVGLVVRICEAVAHAHRSLVVHRDIKPANILVTDAGVPVLVDFGIAKLLGEELDATRTGLRALTPGYAAPEQSAGGAITTATDVYALGAVLERITAQCAPLPTDLRNIVGMAMREDPQRRYQDATALGADLQRWLGRHPVEATPDSLSYRLRMFARRNRGLALTGTLLLLSLVLGVAATAWQNHLVRQEAARANAVKGFLLEIFRASEPDRARGEDPPASQILRSGSALLQQELGDRPQVLAEMLQVIGGIQLARGLLDDARSSLDSALALLDGPAAGLHDVAMRARMDRALVAYEDGVPSEAVQRLQALHADVQSRAGRHAPELTAIEIRLSDMLSVSGHADQALAVARAARHRIEREDDADSNADLPAALRVEGVALHAGGDAEAAIEVLQQAAAAQQQRDPGAAFAATIANDLALALEWVGRTGEAEVELVKALERQQQLYGDVHPATLNTATNLAFLYGDTGRTAEALAAHQQNLERARALYGSGPHVEVANILGMAGIAAWQLGQVSEAQTYANQAWAMLAGISDDDRALLNWIGFLLGTLRMEAGQAPDRSLLSTTERSCDSDALRGFLQFRSCVAEAWLRALDGDCAVFEATPPDAMPPADRLWWAAHQRLAAHCLPDPGGQRAATAAALLAALDQPPAWLTRPWP